MWVVEGDIAGVSMTVYAGFQPVSIKFASKVDGIMSTAIFDVRYFSTVDMLCQYPKPADDPPIGVRYRA